MCLSAQCVRSSPFQSLDHALDAGRQEQGFLRQHRVLVRDGRKTRSAEQERESMTHISFCTISRLPSAYELVTMSPWSSRDSSLGCPTKEGGSGCARAVERAMEMRQMAFSTETDQHTLTHTKISNASNRKRPECNSRIHPRA